jgi:hypothetical protein
MLLIELLIWKFIDFKRELKRIFKHEKKQLHIYGIQGYFGLMGMGKTMAISYQLSQYRKKYGKDVYIMTNYNYLDEDFVFTSWKDLLKPYDKPLIVAWDEVQNEFNSRDFKSFPVELLTHLTQVRKGNGIMLLYSAQRWERVDKVFRELTTFAVQCKTRFGGRLTSLKYYYWEDYMQMNSATVVELKMRIHPTKKVKFVQTDKIRNSYDSFKMLQTAKTKDYVERNIINIDNFYN